MQSMSTIPSPAVDIFVCKRNSALRACFAAAVAAYENQDKEEKTNC
jgi:hypothetical protein